MSKINKIAWKSKKKFGIESHDRLHQIHLLTSFRITSNVSSPLDLLCKYLKKLSTTFFCDLFGNSARCWWPWKLWSGLTIRSIITQPFYEHLSRLYWLTGWPDNFNFILFISLTNAADKFINKSIDEHNKTFFHSLK